jgi:hypothetical protein
VNVWYLRVGSALLASGLALALFLGADGFAAEAPLGAPWDKGAHFLYYGAIGGLLAYALGRRWYWGALLTVALLGALDEWNQFHIPGRQSSPFDWLADVLGALSSIYLYRRWSLRTTAQSSGRSSSPAPGTFPPASV